MIVRKPSWKGTQLAGLGRLRGPEADLLALSSAITGGAAAGNASASSGIVWTDCPDGSTVPANIGCPSYGQTISDFIGANPGTVAIIGGGLFLVLVLMGGRHR